MTPLLRVLARPSDLLQRQLLLWLVVSSCAAYWWRPEWFDPFAATQKLGLLNWLIAAAMFCVGSLLPRDELADLRRRWPHVLGGTAVQYTAMPFLGWATATFFGLDDDARAGTILVGCVPGAMASNVLTLAARGHTSYSVGLTTASTLLSPVVVPLALRLTLGARHEFDPWQIFANLGLTVVGPVLLGWTLARLVAGFERVMQTLGPLLANLAILWIIAVVVGLNRDRLEGVTGLLLAALLATNLLGYAAGWLASIAFRQPESMRRALTLEIGMQNAGLGTVLALNLFPGRPAIAIPTAAYTFGCMLTGTLLATVWSRIPCDADETPAPTATPEPATPSEPGT